jgi:hypothetical protein
MAPGIGSRRDRLGRSVEDREEGIALGLDLEPATRRDGLPDQHPVAIEQRGPGGRAQGLGQPGRALDIGEQEGDGAGRQCLAIYVEIRIHRFLYLV